MHEAMQADSGWIWDGFGEGLTGLDMVGGAAAKIVKAQIEKLKRYGCFSPVIDLN